MIREKLQGGWGRKPIALVAGGLCVGIFHAVWEPLRSQGINVPAEFPKAAFVAAAFSVTAYNLRIRVVDLVIKMEGSLSKISKLCTVAESCGKRLTNLVVLFTVTAVIVAVSGLAPKDAAWTRWTLTIPVFLSGVSTIHFVYILFAFERLEGIVLRDLRTRAHSKEILDLIGPK